MSRCKTGWRIYYDREVPLCANPWTAKHPRGITHYRATFEAAKAAMTRETLRDWDLIDGVWVERDEAASVTAMALAEAQR